MEKLTEKQLQTLKKSALNRVSKCKNKTTITAVLNSQNQQLLNTDDYIPQIFQLPNLKNVEMQNSVIKFTFNKLKHKFNDPQFVGNLLKTYPNAKEIVAKINPELLIDENFIEELIQVDPDLLPNILSEIVADENYLRSLLKNKKLQWQAIQNSILQFIESMNAENESEQEEQEEKKEEQEQEELNDKEFEEQYKKFVENKKALSRGNEEIQNHKNIIKKEAKKQVELVMPPNFRKIYGNEKER